MNADTHGEGPVPGTNIGTRQPANTQISLYAHPRQRQTCTRFGPMSRILCCALTLITINAAAERPATSLFGDACEMALGQDDHIQKSAADLGGVLDAAVAAHLIAPRDLGRHYLAGTRGRKLRTFISYITKQLADDVAVRSVGHPPSPTELAFREDLVRLRKDALAWGERYPTEFPRLTKAWRVTVRRASMRALGLSPRGRGSLTGAIDPSPPIE